MFIGQPWLHQVVPNLSLFNLETPNGPKRKRMKNIFQKKFQNQASMSNTKTMDGLGPTCTVFTVATRSSEP